MNKNLFLEKEVYDIWYHGGIQKLRFEYYKLLEKINLGFFENYQVIINNVFIFEKKEVLMVEIIEKYFRQYYFANKIIRFFRNINKVKNYIIINKKDLLLNEFKNNYLEIKQGNKIYRFTDNDMKNIIIQSLEYHTELIYHPQMPKNPYSNLLFNEYELNCIYKFLEKKKKITEIIKNFRNSQFQIDIFREKYSYFLKKTVIKNHLNNLDKIEILDEFINLLYDLYPYLPKKRQNIMILIKNRYIFLESKLITLLSEFLLITHFITNKLYISLYKKKIKLRLLNLLEIIGDEKSKYIKTCNKRTKKKKKKNDYINHIFSFSEEITLDTSPLKLEKLLFLYDTYWKSNMDLKQIIILLDNTLLIKPINLLKYKQ